MTPEHRVHQVQQGHLELVPDVPEIPEEPLSPVVPDSPDDPLVLESPDEPDVPYYYNNELHYYHSDFYIPEKNLIVEIKSTFTLNYDLEKNLIKEKSCLDKGFNFIFVIDKNYSKLNYFLI